MVGSLRTYFADESTRQTSCCRVMYCGLACCEITVEVTNVGSGRDGRVVGLLVLLSGVEQSESDGAAFASSDNASCQDDELVR